MHDWLLRSRDNRADERFVYIYVSNYGLEGRLQHENSTTQPILQMTIGDKARLIRAVRHFHIIVDELMNETK